MKDKKGQALVEFILILPVFLLLILGTIDIGNIVYQKYHLEAELDSAVAFYKKEHTPYPNTQIIKNENLTTITIEKNITIQTPILNKVISSPYKIEAKRTIYEEA